jgi:Transposase DDE domain
VRLSEHSELRRALQLRSVPDYTTLYRFLRRLDEAAITRALNEVVYRIPLPGPYRRAQVAVDATGLSPGAISTFFVRRMFHHTQQPMPWRHWLKWLVVVDLQRQLVLAQKAHAGPTNDGANLRPLLDTAHTVSSISLVLADAEFDSELNHTHIRQRLGARSVIPAKRGKKTWRIHATAGSSSGSGRPCWTAFCGRCAKTCWPEASSGWTSPSSTPRSSGQKGGRSHCPTRCGKGSKIMAIADRHGLPIAVGITSASPHESKLVEDTLRQRHVSAVPEHMIGDRGYDSDPLDERLQRRARSGTDRA